MQTRKFSCLDLLWYSYYISSRIFSCLVILFCLKWFFCIICFYFHRINFQLPNFGLNQKMLTQMYLQRVLLNYATSHSEPQQTTTTHKEPQRATTTQNNPQQATTSHNDLQQPPRKSSSITLCTLYVLFIIK